MGKYDSSKTRVVPVFEALLKADPTGKTWISRVLELPHREGRLPAPEVLNGPLTAYAWGDHEKRLNAPTALLEHLIDNPGSVGDPRILGSGRTARMRAALVAGDSEVVAGAKRLIRSGDRTRGWQVLEGPSQPDVYLETPEVVVVIEGKRTEAGPTTQTTWMPIRH